uniref:F-box protein n=1 Tax=Kalanchoe fedtschenkoi TaxID=63787 RepID=A0A7N0RAZ2_KALFE
MAGSNNRRSRARMVPQLNEPCIYSIFSHVPAAKILSSVKILSKIWKNETQETVFIEEQLCHSKPGLLIQDNEYPFSRIRHFSIDKGVFKMTDHFASGEDQIQRLQVPQMPTVRTMRVLASCDGVSLVFFNGFDYQGFLVKGLFVANIVKKRMRRIQLPDQAYLHREYCSIGRVPQTREIKVMCPYTFRRRGLRWCVATVGADQSWREIGLTMDVTDRPRNHRSVNIVSCSGVIYLDQASGSQHTTFAVDLSDESVHRVNVPEYNPPDPGQYELLGAAAFPPLDDKFLVLSDSDEYSLPLDGRLVVMRDKVTFIVPQHLGNDSSTLNLYTLADFRSSRWEACDKRVHPDIIRMYISENAVPVAWLDGEDVLVCRVRKVKQKDHNLGYWYSYCLVAYNVRTGRRRRVPGVEVCRKHRVTCHTNSLVWYH